MIGHKGNKNILGLLINIRDSYTLYNRQILVFKMTSQKFLQVFILFGIIINSNFFILGSINKEKDLYFSVYNNDWYGYSFYREAIESRGYEVMIIETSLSEINRLDKSICLVLLGPNQFYDPFFDVPFFIDFFNDDTKNNSIFVAHEHSASNSLLLNISFATRYYLDSDKLFPLSVMAEGILHDNASCLTNPSGQVDPTCPIVKITESHPTTTGIDEVVLSQATVAAGGRFLYESLGWDVIGEATLSYSWVDKNGDGMFKTLPNSTIPADDYIDLSYLRPYLEELLGGGIDLNYLERYPLGGLGFDPVVFLAEELENNRVYISSDASCFSNDLIDECDNLQFGLNIIDWLTYNGIDDPNDWIIVFDETHIGPEDSPDLTYIGIIILISVISLTSVILIITLLKVKNQRRLS